MREGSPPPPVMCHMSRVICHVSHVTCHTMCIFFNLKLVGGGIFIWYSMFLKISITFVKVLILRFYEIFTVVLSASAKFLDATLYVAFSRYRILTN